jgi:oxygen-independent coproporphyrinogen-3 oxidase
VERGLKLNRDDQIRRDAITKVMCDMELDMTAFGALWNIDFKTYFADALADLPPLAADGFVAVEANRLVVKDRGRLFLRNIAMVFDKYLREPATDDKPRYSRTA